MYSDNIRLQALPLSAFPAPSLSLYSACTEPTQQHEYLFTALETLGDQAGADAALEAGLHLLETFNDSDANDECSCWENGTPPPAAAIAAAQKVGLSSEQAALRKECVRLKFMRWLLERDTKKNSLTASRGPPNKRTLELIRRTFDPAVTAALRHESGRRGSSPKFSYAGMLMQTTPDEEGKNVAVGLIHEDADEAVTRDTTLYIRRFVLRGSLCDGAADDKRRSSSAEKPRFLHITEQTRTAAESAADDAFVHRVRTETDPEQRASLTKAMLTRLRVGAERTEARGKMSGEERQAAQETIMAEALFSRHLKEAGATLPALPLSALQSACAACGAVGARSHNVDRGSELAEAQGGAAATGSSSSVPQRTIPARLGKEPKILRCSACLLVVYCSKARAENFTHARFVPPAAA